MINAIKMLLKMAIAILPFVILCINSERVNLQRSERSRQYAMPIVAFVFSFVSMFVLTEINTWIINFINKLPLWIELLASMLPNAFGDVLDSLAGVLAGLIKKLELNFWVFFISNWLLILAYLAIKKAVLALIDKLVKNGSEAHTKVASNFYEYFPEKSKWCLMEKYVQTRSLFKFLYYSALCLSVVLMFVSRYFYQEEYLQALFYPVFGVLIVGELFFYLDGSTKREYSDILGEDEDAYKTVNYSLLRKFLRNLFKDKLLSENTSVNNTEFSDSTNDEVIRELEKSEDGDVTNFAAYIKALNATGAEIDHNYIFSALDMLKGKSVLFNNPFYYDLIPYAFYPMNKALLSHKKVLIVLGRHAIEDDVKKWVEDGIGAVTNIPFLWKTEILSPSKGVEKNTDIGIVTRSDVLDIRLHNANAEFLDEVGFVVIIEPSKLISTAQIGLNLIIKKCRGEKEKNITYCLCDKNCDGLVDAMSHILMTSLTEVSATKKHMGTSSYMCWEADNDYLHHRIVPNISRYLGFGTELSYVALKNQVSKTRWYGGEAFPVADMRWISKQYYYDLMKYAGLPTSQEAMDERFLTSSNFWSARVEDNNYFTVEDEAFNMFEILRNFATRSKVQGFINVISSEYLLKDYMADNASIFETDAKAIPNIVADYVRSMRNTILRLVLMMSTFPVNGEVLKKELSLMGIRVFDIRKQLWYEIYRCYADTVVMNELSTDYQVAVEQASQLTLRRFGEGETKFDISILVEADLFNAKLGKIEHTFSIKDDEFLNTCVKELKSAGYVAEDEKGDKYYLGSELSGHIYQKYLPGQFFTFGGKYYEMRYLTADNQVLVRRAADHITDRPAYRQMRSYVISGIRRAEQIGAVQDVAGMKMIHEYADISVETQGYFKMQKYSDFATAKAVLFEGEKSGIPTRRYYNKEILRIELPEASGKRNDKIRYTVAMLLNEVFKSIFAENSHYIVALTDDAFITDDRTTRPLTYSLEGVGCEIDKNSIYIVEDSQLDLGLTVAVERNWQRILEIVEDYIAWHLDSLESSLNPPKEPVPPITFVDPENPDADKPKKGLVGRIWDRIRGWFGGGKKKKGKDDEEPKTPTAVPNPPDEAEPSTPDGENKEGAEKPKKKRGFFGGIWDKIRGWFGGGKKKKGKDDEEPKTPTVDPDSPDTVEPPVSPVGEDTPGDDGGNNNGENSDPENDNPDAPGGGKPDGSDNGGAGKEIPELVNAAGDGLTFLTEDDKVLGKAISFERKPYHHRYFLLFGGESEPDCIAVSETLDYLDAIGLAKNPLRQARDGRDVAELIEAAAIDNANARYCDFCGALISGVEFETLADGRDRCTNCSRTAIKTGAEFRKIFEDVKRNMEAFFGIKINVGIHVEMVNSKRLHKMLGYAFIPTPENDGRILGVAIKDKNGYSLVVENGSPRMASMLTMAHELTHIWQYINWDDKAIRKKYGDDLRLEIYEGMAKWAEIQYAYLINEPRVAKREEIVTANRNDEYGRGFLRYLAQYSFSFGTVITKTTPFMNVENPLDMQFCGPISYTPQLPENGDDGDGGKAPGGGKNPGGGKTHRKPIKGTVERDAQNVRMYAFEALSTEEKEVYNIILDAILSFKSQITSLKQKVTDSQVVKILHHIQTDHPEIFWFQHGATYYFNKDSHIVNKIELKFCLTESEKKSRQEQIDAEVKKFVESIRDDMSDYEVALKVYENIINLVDYDTVGLERQKKLKEVACDKPDDLRSIYGVFVEKKAVCVGYSKALQYLLNILGIECTYVTSDTHAWNMVKLEGDYYHLDVTWGDGSDTNAAKNSAERIRYDCFCITTEELLKIESHTPDGRLPLPNCTALSCNYHRRNGLFFDKFAEDEIRVIVCENIEKGKLDVSLKFADKGLFDLAVKELIEKGKLGDMLRYSNLKSNRKVELRYTYFVNAETLVFGAKFTEK